MLSTAGFAGWADGGSLAPEGADPHQCVHQFVLIGMPGLPVGRGPGLLLDSQSFSSAFRRIGANSPPVAKQGATLRRQKLNSSPS